MKLETMLRTSLSNQIKELKDQKQMLQATQHVKTLLSERNKDDSKVSQLIDKITKFNLKTIDTQIEFFENVLAELKQEIPSEMAC